MTNWFAKSGKNARTGILARKIVQIVAFSLRKLLQMSTHPNLGFPWEKKYVIGVQ
jgi:hypothetical protein